MSNEFKGNDLFHRSLSAPAKCYFAYDETDSADNKIAPLFRVVKNISACSTVHRGVLTDYSRLVVIGDSLSDSEGNMYAKTFGFLPSAPQYYEGRFTNGFTWVDFISSPHLMKTTVVNKSEGGALSGSYCKLNPLYIFLSNMNRQIRSLSFNVDDLVIVSLGANDYITINEKNAEKVVINQCLRLEKIIKKGARSIVVLGVPDLSQTPYALKSTPEYRQEKKELSVLHNKLLSQRIDEINKNHAANILYFDVASTMNEIKYVADQEGYNTNDAFTNGYIGGSGQLDTAPQYMFNDNVHPTQEIHAAFAIKLYDFIAEKLPDNKK
ncbi:hypothetical protein BTJ39_06425 [Izhakiella australiensis]|uniref:SGNH hydrolase-type esterase domain-containing protein n=1 Tax=Izhakiella australiensis TaxID=1926881 RepID=A0A1S8YNT4_9GAMM|nr:SGNH/GDSL hydrolase family protein [Izhakiella australiensis]OON40714.1 hypothetical protein BTJ39_06425 [Izhakiella australiensis]